MKFLLIVLALSFSVFANLGQKPDSDLSKVQCGEMAVVDQEKEPGKTIIPTDIKTEASNESTGAGK
jgi:hypothetical protein